MLACDRSSLLIEPPHTIHSPAERPRYRMKVPPSGMRRSAKTSRIYQVLLIEDEPAVADWVANLLRESPNGLFVASARAARLSKGIDLLHSGNPDIILLDLMLPDSQGIQTFQKMHAEAPHIPIVVLSSLEDDELATRIVHLGAQEYLVKHRLDPESLQRALRYAMERFQTEL